MYIQYGLPLHHASRKGDWKAGESILNQHGFLVRYSISKKRETMLHVAISAQKTKFVENILRLMEKKDLELQTLESNTALCVAAKYGNVELAKMLLEINGALLNIPDNQGMTPLSVAASFGSRDMIIYLYESSERRTPQSCFLLTCLEANIFGKYSIR